MISSGLSLQSTSGNSGFKIILQQWIDVKHTKIMHFNNKPNASGNSKFLIQTYRYMQCETKSDRARNINFKIRTAKHILASKNSRFFCSFCLISHRYSGQQPLRCKKKHFFASCFRERSDFGEICVLSYQKIFSLFWTTNSLL